MDTFNFAVLLPLNLRKMKKIMLIAFIGLSSIFIKAQNCQSSYDFTRLAQALTSLGCQQKFQSKNLNLQNVSGSMKVNGSSSYHDHANMIPESSF